MSRAKQRAGGFITALWQHRNLWLRLTKREIQSRYQGSALGMAWTVINPLIMLAVYTFVFATIFKARWGTGTGSSEAEFALNLFAGLITFNLFSECITRSPLLIVNNPSYVTKLIFPVEIMPAICLGASVFHASCSLIVLESFQLLFKGALPLTSLWLPIVWLPLVCFTLAASWILAALGVYLRDLDQSIGSLVSILMFMSAVFYPAGIEPTCWHD
jgi:lipopolysaccharide transport system permease protein